MKRISIAAIMVGLMTINLSAQDDPPFTIPDITLSSDKRFGITVPNELVASPDQERNAIVEVKTGEKLGLLQDEYTAVNPMSHGGIAPTLWTADDSILLWQVDGKWGYETQVLIKLKNGKIDSQVDVLKLIRQAILKRTQEAVPDKYEAVKQDGAGDGSWWQDGFAIDPVLDAKPGPLHFPLRFQVYLTSNPKDFARDTSIDARMTAEVDRDGKLTVIKFYLGTKPRSRNWD